MARRHDRVELELEVNERQSQYARHKELISDLQGRALVPEYSAWRTPKPRSLLEQAVTIDRCREAGSTCRIASQCRSLHHARPQPAALRMRKRSNDHRIRRAWLPLPDHTMSDSYNLAAARLASSHHANQATRGGDVWHLSCLCGRTRDAPLILRPAIDRIGHSRKMPAVSVLFAREWTALKAGHGCRFRGPSIYLAVTSAALGEYDLATEHIHKPKLEHHFPPAAADNAESRCAMVMAQRGVHGQERSPDVFPYVGTDVQHVHEKADLQ